MNKSSFYISKSIQYLSILYIATHLIMLFMKKGETPIYEISAGLLVYVLGFRVCKGCLISTWGLALICFLTPLILLMRFPQIGHLFSIYEMAIYVPGAIFLLISGIILLLQGLKDYLENE